MSNAGSSEANTVSLQLQNLPNLLREQESQAQDARRICEERQRDRQRHREEKDHRMAQLRSQLLQISESSCSGSDHRSEPEAADATTTTGVNDSSLSKESSRLMEQTIEQVRQESRDLLRSFCDDIRRTKDQHMELIVAAPHDRRGSA